MGVRSRQVAAYMLGLWKEECTSFALEISALDFEPRGDPHHPVDAPPACLQVFHLGNAVCLYIFQVRDPMRLLLLSSLDPLLIP